MRYTESVRGFRPGIVTLPPSKPYVYRGSQPLESDPNVGAGARAVVITPPPPKERKAFNDDACGTPRGFYRHRNYGNTCCGPCAEAKREYDRKYYAEHGKKKS